MHETFTDQAGALHVAGIELRTRNDEAADTIPAFWRRFGDEGVIARLPQRLGDDVYAVYTHFENAGLNNRGWYSLVIGAAWPADAPLPAGMVRAVVPASRRAVFPVPAGRPDQVGAAWQAIWQRGDLSKTFLADYERYAPDGRIDISIGLAAQHVAA
jgi:predicted transcriptional regulator YdeE